MILLFNKSASITLVTYIPTGISFTLKPGEKKVLQYSDLGSGITSADITEFAYDPEKVYIDTNYSA